MNIEKCLDYYCDAFYHEFWGINHVIHDEEVLKQQAIDFLHQYAMNEIEYKNICVPVMQKVFKFSPQKRFDINVMSMAEIIEEGFEYFSYYSSPLFWKESYELILKICTKYGDKNIFIVEEECCEKDSEVAFKIKIPVNLPWEKVSKGGYITDVLFNRSNCNYYVFGDSGMWGKWCDYDNAYSDYETFCYRYVVPPILEYEAFFSEYITDSLSP